MPHPETGYLAENYASVLSRIGEAARRSNRSPSEITLVAVTKTVPPDIINALLSLGARDIGENKAQELLAKYAAVEAEEFRPNWHFIGHLQRNKVRQIVDKAAMIHSLDSLPLAVEIDLRAAAINKVMDVLIEVNVAAEPNKYGVRPEDAPDFAEKLGEMGHLRLRGLMCVAPDVEFPEENRLYFQKMREILVDIRKKLVHNEFINCLSMGMTGDYAVAIEEGATVVRIGTGIFGKRKIQTAPEN
ncbi:MAG: YggS family pyridoxal phosphate-dependent enzyme [Firmicutes bacterium]|nr:YggS family pyridoxal phosphate-dependent enzyme [Bacillota bacterium]